MTRRTLSTSTCASVSLDACRGARGESGRAESGKRDCRHQEELIRLPVLRGIVRSLVRPVLQPRRFVLAGMGLWPQALYHYRGLGSTEPHGRTTKRAGPARDP
jgi:hypothetical protein